MRFKKVYIEITNVCNLNCSFCAKNERPPQFMSREDFAYILDQIKPYTNYIYLHVLGEPLLHPDLPALLKLADDKEMHVNMTTNAVLLKEKTAILKGNVRQVNLSLHSKPLQDGIHSEHYLQDCLEAGDALAQAGTYISYRLWNMKAGTLDPESRDMLETIGRHYEIQITQSVKQCLAERRFLHFEEEFVWPSLQNALISECGTCYGLRSMCAILVDGTLVPCCLDSRGECALGNVFTTPLETLLNQEHVRDIQEGFSRQRLLAPLCQRCGYRTRFDIGGKS